MDELRDRYRSPSDVVDRLMQLRRQIELRERRVRRNLEVAKSRNEMLQAEIDEREAEIAELREVETELNGRLP
jgi:chromosome segregation ATPase